MKRRWTQEELIELFTLDSKELGYLKGMVNHNRLGFAVLLKVFQHEGRFPRSKSSVPKEVIEHLAKQLKTPPLSFQQSYWQERTIKRHRVKIRNLLGFRQYSQADLEKIIKWLCKVVLPDNQKEEFLQETLSKYLLDNRIEPPSQSQIERLIHAAQKIYENHLFDRICERLSQKTWHALDELLQPETAEGEPLDAEQSAHTPLLSIKAHIGKASLNTVLGAVTQLEKLKRLDLPPDLFISISPKTVERFRHRAAMEPPGLLRRHPRKIRYTLLAALCLCRQGEITDDLVECIIQIVHKMGQKPRGKSLKSFLLTLNVLVGKQTYFSKLQKLPYQIPRGASRKSYIQ